jgi:hypothetical protein
MQVAQVVILGPPRQRRNPGPKNTGFSEYCGQQLNVMNQAQPRDASRYSVALDGE